MTEKISIFSPKIRKPYYKLFYSVYLYSIFLSVIIVESNLLESHGSTYKFMVAHTESNIS